MGFGNLLRRLRLAAGLSQEALAERARVSAKAIGSLEIGTRRAPYRETVDQLLHALNATAEERSQLLALAERARLRGPRAASPGSSPNPSEAVPPTNLPIHASTLVGRARELARAAALLETNRLVTLVGAGGIGKTRVALSVATEQAHRCSDGAWFVDLAPLRDSSVVPNTVAMVLGLSEKHGVPITNRVTEFLRARKALIVLDNCEHVLNGVAELVEAMLRTSQSLHILATSREPLRADGEIVYEIPSLEFPPSEIALDEMTALKYPAVELFSDRARALDGDFIIGNHNAHIVGEIVRRLDGLPLAIELAAARVRALGVATIAQRLDERFELLAEGTRAAPPRQQTMRALIRWSYDLLSAPERSLFRRLSIFAGGWSLKAAEAVCDDEVDDFLTAFASLVDKSLVSRQRQGNAYRYGFLETTRAFASEELTTAERDSLALRHAHWVEASLRAAYDRAATDGSQKRLSGLMPELDNVRSALEWCERNAARSLGGQIASTIGDLFAERGLAEEGSRWVVRMLKDLSEDAEPGLLAQLYCSLAKLTGDAKTRLEASERAVALAERAGEAELLGLAYMRYDVALTATGRFDEALIANERACHLLRGSPVQPNLRVAWTLRHRSWTLVRLGRLDEARTCIEEALVIFKQRGAERDAWRLCIDLAEIEFAAGRAERALEIVDEAIPVAANIDDPHRESILTCNRAGYLVGLGDFAEAEATAREGLLLAERTQSMERTAYALEHLAAALACREKSVPAALLFGFVGAWFTRSGYERGTTERSSSDILTAALHRALSEEDLTALSRLGAAMTRAEALETARATSPSYGEIALADNCAGQL